VIEGVVALVIDLALYALSGVNFRRVAKRLDCGGRSKALPLKGHSEAGGSRGVAVPSVLDVETFGSILRKIKIGEEGKRIASAEIAAEGRGGVVRQQVGGDAGAAYVLVSIDREEELAAEQGRSGFIRILIAVEHREEKVSVVIFRAFVIDVV